MGCWGTGVRASGLLCKRTGGLLARAAVGRAKWHFRRPGKLVGGEDGVGVGGAGGPKACKRTHVYEWLLVFG